MIEYKPNWLFKHKHINTCFPTLFRKIKLDYTEREKINTFDGDILYINWVKNNNKKLLILCHGLEGSSKSKYIQGHGKYFSERGWDIIAINYRGCVGENQKPSAYHGGLTDDLKLLIEEKGKDYEIVVIGGFSLGGNIVLKYLGTETYPKNLKCGFAVSPPCDFFSSNNQLKKPENKIYSIRFLKKLKNKCEEKYQNHPEWRKFINIEKIRESKTIEEFDDAYTGRFFGFNGYKDYYSKVSSKKNIVNISIPTYILTPLDDPMMGKECYPYEEANQNKNITLETPTYGGHVGFASFKDYPYILEEKTYEFVRKVLEKSF
ncbi:YheT family hydrolase [Fusobacterium perfoetens]|uniref:YheT family hydrolase n=1 Tax=Fusobacterium perfoetens TaxID=852 RepID=UPI000484786F|nr:alpha/beta fold hydrolase [Fusobacterium perfoetens]